MPASGAAVLLGSDFKALAAARSLSRRGVRVVVVDSDPRSAWFSRHVDRRIRWHSGLDDAALVDTLMAAAGDQGLAGAVLFPMQDDSLELVSRHHARLATAFVLTTPPWEVVRRAHQKSLLYEAADLAGVDHPATWRPATVAELRRLPVRFPAIVKPAVSTALVRSLRRKALYAADMAQLVTWYELALQHVPARDLLVQEFIPGGGESQYSFSALVDEGSVLASMTARRLRQYPIDFGMSSSLVQAVRVPDLEEPARRLLRELRLSGLVELEFKQHPVTRAFHLLDANPRVWAWHGLCAKAGVDFVDLEFRRVTGQTLPRVEPSYPMTWRRGLTDIPSGISSMRAGKISVRSYRQSLRGPVVRSVFDIRDPLPALADVPVAVLRLARRQRGTPKSRNEVGGVAERPQTH